MGMTKNEERTIRKITKMGKSLGLTLPVDELRELGWKEHQKVRVKRIRGGFEIQDWRKN